MISYKKDWDAFRQLVKKAVQLDTSAILLLLDEMICVYWGDERGDIICKIKSKDRNDKMFKIFIDEIPFDEPRGVEIIRSFKDIIRKIKLSNNNINLLLHVTKNAFKENNFVGKTTSSNMKMFVGLLEEEDKKKNLLDNLEKIGKNQIEKDALHFQSNVKKQKSTPSFSDPDREVLLNALQEVVNKTKTKTKTFYAKDIMNLLHFDKQMKVTHFIQSRFVQKSGRNRAPGQLPRKSNKNMKRKHDPKTGYFISVYFWSRKEVETFLKGILDRNDIEIPPNIKKKLLH